MKQFKFKWLQVSLIAVLALFSLPGFTEPANLTLLLKDIATYHDSGLYEKEITDMVSTIHDYVLHAASDNRHEKTPKKLAIVFDIDETTLSNYNEMLKRHFVHYPKRVQKEILAANAPAMPGMLALYDLIRAQGIKVFFVTGRKESLRQATRTNLLKVGYKHWAGLYLKPETYQEASNVPFKSQARAHITKLGYTIIASVGDQISDLEGGYTLKGFKIPNPFYYLP